MQNILAVGDCVTLGTGACTGNSYPERVGRSLDSAVVNRSKGMCTSREGKALLRDHLTTAYDCVILQFGIADAYTTFKYAPYILYYPDNIVRKTVRNIVKKYKKVCRRHGLHERFGEANVIAATEYRANYQKMITMCGSRLVILPETIPHHEAFRNPHIKKYNGLLEELAAANSNCCLVRVFDDFSSNLSTFYQDKGHPNDPGYEHITQAVLDSLAHHNQRVKA